MVAFNGIHVCTRKNEGTGGHYVTVGKILHLAISDIAPNWEMNTWWDPRNVVTQLGL